MRYVIDIDNTICISSDDYTNASPIQNRIKQINSLFDEGNIVIYFTARGMGRYNNDRSLAESNFRELTINQLNSWGCKYHNVIFGKVSGDVYIDDKGIKADDFFKN